MLASVTFDGFVETPVWAAISERLAAPPPVASLDSPIAASADTGAWVQTAALAIFPLLFLGVYLAVCRLVARCAALAAPAGAPIPASQVARSFVLTLIPIAIAYQLAHYLSFLAMGSKYLIPLASDPFGFGWDLFGSANYFVRMGMVDARLLWNVSIAAIVAGHIAAVYLAHVMAMRVFADKRAALWSQLPMLVLMVSYTMVSLWIMAQPIVVSRFG